MGRLSQTLLPPRKRLLDLQQQVDLLQGQLRAGQRIEVIATTVCGHDECGAPPPQELPAECLVLELGCGFEIPARPAVEQPQHQSRAERPNPEQRLGQGISPERQQRLLQTIRLL